MILLDLILPDAQHPTAIKLFIKEHSSVPIIVISAIDRRDVVVEYLDAGAAGYVTKTSKLEVIISALRIVAAGARFVPPEALESRFEEQAQLTQRQREVLRLALGGARNRQIAAELSISENTVKQHLHAIYERFGIKSRAELEQKYGGDRPTSG